MSADRGLTPSERSLRGRVGAYALHAQHDSRLLTGAARAAFLSRFEREVDPDGTLPEASGSDERSTPVERT